MTIHSNIIRLNNFTQPEDRFSRSEDVYEVISALSRESDEMIFSDYEDVKCIQLYYFRFGNVWVCVYPEISCELEFEGFGIRFCNEPSESEYEIRRSNR